MSIKVKQLILSFVFFLMVGCASEPMIKLSEENQSIIEAKKQAQQGNENPSNGESSTEPDPETPSEPAEDKQVLTAFDTTQWQVLEEGALSLTIDQFLPNVAYQIKQFGNGSESKVDYVDFIDEASQSMQVESRVGEDIQLTFYQWDSSQLIQTGQELTENPYINQLATLTPSPETNLVLLQAPLQVGTSWQANGSMTSEITAIYQLARLGDLEFDNVVEVTSVSESGQQQAYYAAGEGLIGILETDSNGELVQAWQAQAIYHDNRIINEIEVMVPSQADSLVEPSTAPFKWQTNQNYANAFDSLLKDLGILNETITVNAVSLEEGVAVIDFTPGVVAVLNSYDAPEQAVIASIVTTVGDFFNTDQVRLTVSGVGMLPDTIDYPANGIYQVSVITQQQASAEEGSPANELESSSNNATESSQSLVQ